MGVIRLWRKNLLIHVRPPGSPEAFLLDPYPLLVPSELVSLPEFLPEFQVFPLPVLASSEESRVSVVVDPLAE